MYCLLILRACAMNSFLPRECQTSRKISNVFPICFQARKILTCYRDVECVQSPELLLCKDKLCFQISSVTTESQAQSAQSALGPPSHRASSVPERAQASQASVPFLLPTTPLPRSAARVGARATEAEGSRLIPPSSLFLTQPSSAFPPPPPRPSCPGEGAASGAAQLPQHLLQAGGPSHPQGRDPSVLGKYDIRLIK